MLNINDIHDDINVEELANALRNAIFYGNVFEDYTRDDCSREIFKEGTESYELIWNKFCDEYTCSQCRALVATFIKENCTAKKNNIYLWK